MAGVCLPLSSTVAVEVNRPLKKNVENENQLAGRAGKQNPGESPVSWWKERMIEAIRERWEKQEQDKPIKATKPLQI